MEVALVSPQTIRIKGKVASFLVDPVPARAKQQADAIIWLTSGLSIDPTTIENLRVELKGPGEYEVAGVKVTGVKNGQGTFYLLSLDGMTIVLANASVLKGKEHAQDAHMIVLHANEPVESSALASFNPQAVVVYGSQAGEVVKTLGKEAVTGNKFAVTKDKLSAEMQVVLLQ